ncbi:MAG: hypothetical protein AAF125_12915 [Chloroflexota bacterium]
MNFSRFLFGESKPPRRQRTKSNPYAIYNALYPESVRYALQYREAQLGVAEMRDLVDRFPFETVYLVVKAYAEIPDNQRAFLEDLACLYAVPGWTERDLSDLLRKHIDTLPAGVTVTGTKLAQLNRYGADHWQATFRKLAEDMFANNPLDIPCLIAHTPLLSFHHFVEVYTRQGSRRKLMVLVPDWMEDKANPMMGYEVNLRAPFNVRLQEKDECLFGQWECYKHDCPLKQHFCSTVVFVDDTINTGTTSSKLTSFWHTEYGLNLPAERVRVITDLRGKGYPKAKAKK